MKFTIAYFTNRIEPKFEWFLDSLLNQIDETIDVDLIFIDNRVDEDGQSRIDMLKSIVDGRIEYRHIAPKYNPWQGRGRKTLADFFAASNARNTAFIHARTDYILCVDDLSVLSPSYIENAKHAVENKYLVLGSYKKLEEMVVENGVIKSHEKEHVDSRWSIGSDSGVVPATPNILYGCSFGLPVETAIKVNGFDEAFDGMGFEDCDFGIRCQRTGIPMYYNRNMLTCESHELHDQPGCNALRRLKLAPNGEALDWYMLNNVNGNPKRITTVLQRCDIKSERKRVAKGLGTSENDYYNDWVDDKPYAEMTNLDRAGSQIVAESILKDDGKSVCWEHVSK